MISVIPKLIHYCWFGGNSKPALVRKCIESWKKFMPDYEIIEWNESNYDVNKVPFTNEAYQCKKWAFVSDYARFDVINQYGGIYFDTDVELIKSIPDTILQNKAFTGFEYAGNVSPGLIFAATAGNRVTEEILARYDNLHFLQNGKMKFLTVNMIITDILKPYGLVQNNEYQVVNELTIYPSEYFCGFDQDIKEILVTDKTISIHHYAGTWAKKSLKRLLSNYIKKLFGVNMYRKILRIKRLLNI